LPWTDVLNNVALPLKLMGRAKKEALDAAKDALERVGLGDALTKYPAELSGGMKMRASVARALVAQPSLLLLDEPFAALDENTRHRLQEELRLLWQRAKMTVVFVTHSVSEAVYLSNRAIVLSRRPARILLDARIDLPEARPKKIRTEPGFIRQMDLIYEAFQDGEDL
jgi:NitT/TauT family transport system ATP-binding protein